MTLNEKKKTLHKGGKYEPIHVKSMCVCINKNTFMLVTIIYVKYKHCKYIYVCMY